jgi:hypothetical protein
VSNKSSLKDKIKKPNATQAFFNSYDTETIDDKDDNKDDIKKDIVNKNENNTDNKNKNNKDNNNDIENKTYVNNNNVVNVDVDDVNVEDEDDDYLRNLASGKKTSKKKAKKVFTSFYMDPDIATEVDKIAARGEKGDKSKLINKAIRKLLEEYGVLERK